MTRRGSINRHFGNARTTTRESRATSVTPRNESEESITRNIGLDSPRRGSSEVVEWAAPSSAATADNAARRGTEYYPISVGGLIASNWRSVKHPVTVPIRRSCRFLERPLRCSRVAQACRPASSAPRLSRQQSRRATPRRCTRGEEERRGSDRRTPERTPSLTRCTSDRRTNKTRSP